MATLLKNISLTVLALVITLTSAVSVIGEEIVLTTIIPGQDTVRVKKGAIGGNYKDIDDGAIDDDNLIIEGNVGIGTPTPATKLEVQGGVIKATGGLITQTVANQGDEDLMAKVDGQLWFRTDINP